MDNPALNTSGSNFPSAEWNQLVNRVLNVWSGYQLAVQMEAGGPDTREKNEWFASVLAEHVHDTKGLKVDSLEEWIESILYTDFDLVLEDDSVNPTAHLLIELHGYLKSNNRMRLQQLLATLPSEESIRNATRSSHGVNADDASTSGDDDDEDEAMREEDEDNNNPGTSANREPKERQPRTVTDDDGWTTIIKRK